MYGHGEINWRNHGDPKSSPQSLRELIDKGGKGVGHVKRLWKPNSSSRQVTDGASTIGVLATRSATRKTTRLFAIVDCVACRCSLNFLVHYLYNT